MISQDFTTNPDRGRPYFLRVILSSQAVQNNLRKCKTRYWIVCGLSCRNLALVMLSCLLCLAIMIFVGPMRRETILQETPFWLRMVSTRLPRGSGKIRTEAIVAS